MLPSGCPGDQFTHVVTEPSNHRKTLSTAASVSSNQMVSLKQKVTPLLAMIAYSAGRSSTRTLFTMLFCSQTPQQWFTQQHSSFVNWEVIFGDIVLATKSTTQGHDHDNGQNNIYWNTLLEKEAGQKLTSKSQLKSICGGNRKRMCILEMLWGHYV